MTPHRRALHEVPGAAGPRLYAQRQGIAGTIAQGVRARGLSRTRYRGLTKT